MDQFFYQGTITAQRYLHLLPNEVEELVDNFPLAIIVHNILTHLVGCTQNAGVVAAPNERYPEHWLGTNGWTQWPARTPDLTSIDFFI